MKNDKGAPLKIMHEQVGMQDGSPLRVRFCDYANFRYPLHQHGELEIIYIIESTGTRYVGNRMEDYGPGDLVLLGSYLPHMYKSDAAYYSDGCALRVRAIIVQFSIEFARSAFFSYPEMRGIASLLEDAGKGIFFPKEGSAEIVELLYALPEKRGCERLVCFLRMLDAMNRCGSRQLLNTSIEDGRLLLQGDERVTRILGYINQHYTERVSVGEVARVACMNASAFCRFFKGKTGKGFVEYVNELRVAYVCKLLSDGTFSVSQVCYQSGFNNVSGFNRIFRRIIGLSPTEYMNHYRRIEAKE